MLAWKITAFFALACMIAGLALGEEDGADYHQQRRRAQDDITYEAEAYECNPSNARIKRNTRFKEGENMKICVTPTRETRAEDVFILKIANFEFIKAGSGGSAAVRQSAVKDGLVGDNGKTVMQCWSGSTICSITTELREAFFETDGEVKAVGEVALQIGDDSVRHLLPIRLYQGPGQRRIRSGEWILCAISAQDTAALKGRLLAGIPAC